jgi:hypothetical protein
MRPWLILLGISLAAQATESTTRILVAASKGSVIPQSKGGGGFQRSFLFTAKPGKANHWIRQALAVRGSVIDKLGAPTTVHLDVVEYYRVGSSGRAIQHDSHYSQFWKHFGGDLTISSSLTYGRLTAKKRGDSILGKSFILRSCTDARGRFVTMKKRTTKEVIPAEKGKRVDFRGHAESIPTRYSYRVQWDVRKRTQPSGKIETGTWQFVPRPQSGRTKEPVRPRPIPSLKARN